MLDIPLFQARHCLHPEGYVIPPSAQADHGKQGGWTQATHTDSPEITHKTRGHALTKCRHTYCTTHNQDCFVIKLWNKLKCFLKNFVTGYRVAVARVTCTGHMYGHMYDHMYGHMYCMISIHRPCLCVISGWNNCKYIQRCTVVRPTDLALCKMCRFNHLLPVHTLCNIEE